MAGMFLSAGHHEKRLEFEKKIFVSINLKSIGTYLKMCLAGNIDSMNERTVPKLDSDKKKYDKHF